MKLCTIVGARPQFIKAAAVERALARRPGDLESFLIHTGQHYDANMSGVFFEELDIPRPRYHLGIGGGSHGQNTGRMIEGIEAVLLDERPDGVLVYGDTDSTLAAALAAVKLRIPIVHVEAGLRSFNRLMPEEINRVLTDHASDLLFTPTATATRNLAREGIPPEKIRRVGDVMFDAVLYYGDRAERRSRILERLKLAPKSFVLATIHRAESVEDPARIANILEGFAGSPLPLVWPLHPRTRRRLADFGLALPRAVRAIDPIGYLDMTLLEKNACLIATDSGGVQKEAYFHRVPCITLRDETEWVELLELGANRLVGTAPAAISAALDRAGAVTVDSWDAQPFGDGRAAARIAECLPEHLHAARARA